MEIDIFDELDAKLSNLGCETIWKRKIGNYLIWISPPNQEAQMMINETMANTDFGVHAISEIKRTSLSFAIVGIDGVDLSKYDQFGPFKKGDKQYYLTRQKYLHEKIKKWGAQYIDDVFKVFSDLMETHEKDNLKDIHFENLKEPREELDELEVRAAEIRSRMGLPPLKESAPITLDMVEERENTKEEPEQTTSDANPFNAVPPDVLEKAESTPLLRVDQAQVKVKPIQVPDEIPVEKPKGVTRIDEKLEAIQAEMAASAALGSQANPHQSLPSIAQEVIDQPSSRIDPKQVIIDRVPTQNVNPRFAKPRTL